MSYKDETDIANDLSVDYEALVAGEVALEDIEIYAYSDGELATINPVDEFATAVMEASSKLGEQVAVTLIGSPSSQPGLLPPGTEVRASQDSPWDQMRSPLRGWSDAL